MTGVLIVTITIVIMLIQCYRISHKKITPKKMPYITEYELCESWIERRLYKRLVKEGYRVEAQVPCKNYRIDLVLTDYAIAIECDGKAYHSSPDQKRHDHKKDSCLRRNGFSVLRFTGSDINGHMDRTIREIYNRVNKRAKLRVGEG